MSVPYRTTSYGDFLSHFGALVGVDSTDFNTTELNIARTFFNRAIRKSWESQIWTDLCPQGEVRFPANLVMDPNLVTGAGTYTTANATTITPVSFPNPLDNRTTAALVLETNAMGPHNVQPVFAAPLQSVTFQSKVTYVASGYAVPGIRTWLYVSVNDGGGAYSAFYNLVAGAPIVGTVSGIGGGGALPQCSITPVGNGFYLWSFSFVSSTSASTGAFTVGFSPDGSTTSYAGNSSAGMYLWGTTLYLTQNQIPASYLIPFTQVGESAIDSVYNIWNTDPGASNLPRKVKYLLNPNGIEIIGPNYCGPTIINPAATNQTTSSGTITQGPLYLYYRPQRPVFAGANYNAASTYAYGNTMYYTTTAGVSDYYSCAVATTAGQNPDTTPSSWSVIPIPYVLFEYCVYDAYANWLQTEGQAAKAQAAYAYAQTCLDDENDRQERQNGQIMPWTVRTHLTSRPGLAR